MDEEQLETPAAEENEEEIELDIPEEEEESIETLRAKLDEERKSREQAEKAFNDQKRRAELAEKKPKEQKPKETDLSSTDLYALIQNQVPQEDIAEVARAAKILNVDIKEALQTNVVKTILADNAEMRRSAEVAATGSARRSSGKVSSDSLLANARKGSVPDSDEEMVRLVEASIMAAKNGN